MNEDKRSIEAIIIDKWYRLQKAAMQEAPKQENLAYLRGSFTGFCQMAELAGIVSGEDIERCQQEAMARFENREVRWLAQLGKLPVVETGGKMNEGI